MNLAQYDKKTVRIIMDDGEIYEGVCVYENQEFMECEFGIDENCIRIDDFLFRESMISRIEPIAKKGEFLFCSIPQKTRIVSAKLFDRIESSEEIMVLFPMGPEWSDLNRGDILRFISRDEEADVWHMEIRDTRVCTEEEAQRAENSGAVKSEDLKPDASEILLITLGEITRAGNK